MAEVQLPQLGESVAEGIITRWLVDVGDDVTVDQPIAEISTDKVDTEIPSPVAGTVKELRFDVDDTVEVGQVIAIIGEGDTSPDDTDDTPTDDDEAKATDAADTDDEDASDNAGKDTGGGKRPAPTSSSATEGPRMSPRVRKMLADAGVDPSDVDATGDGGRITREDAERAIASPPAQATSKPAAAPSQVASAPAASGGPQPRMSPIVRKLLRDAGIDHGQVSGTGDGGRITREDAERAIASPPAAPAGTTGSPARERPPASPTQIDFGGQREATQDLSRIRKVIASSMMDSLHSTAQLTSAVEVDVTAIMMLRNRAKDDFKATHGVSLSPLALIARAVCMTLPRHPALNASIDQDEGSATYHDYVNLGMAVDTERGLLVPNIKDAQELDAAGMARAIADLAARTRDKKLGPDEIAGGTFTITNTGSMGTLFDTPILNPPEVAILATPAIEKRPVVISDGLSDAIAIRWMTYLCLTYDHRMVDGADAARFLQDLKYVLEEHDLSGELG